MSTLFNRLQTLLSTSTLQWLSESQSPLEAVQMSEQDLVGYDLQPGCADGWLGGQCQYGNRTQWLQLIRLFAHESLLAYRKPAGKPGEYKLVLAVRQGLWWVGFRTVVVET